MMRYLRLLRVQLRASLLLAMQYRLDFVVNTLMMPFWTATALVPLLVLFRHRPSIAGWSWAEALIVVGWFTTLKGIIEGAIQPSLQEVVERIRKGTLDFILLKPADAQFLVSTSRFDFAKGANVLAGMGLVGYGLRAVGHVPSVLSVAVTLALLGGAVVILYSTWILVVSLAFTVVKVDNLSYLFASIYDAARWPSSVFRGFLAIFFTFVIPLTLMTTFPALSILGRLSLSSAGFALLGAAVFAFLARRVWTLAIGRYTSAGG